MSITIHDGNHQVADTFIRLFKGQRAKGSGNLEDKFNGGHLSGFYSKLEEVLNEHSDEDTLVREVERLLVDRGERSGTAPSTNYHSAIFCNFSFELIPNETTIATKSTCKQTNFLTERFV